jgi:hypothetical protein
MRVVEVGRLGPLELTATAVPVEVEPGITTLLAPLPPRTLAVAGVQETPLVAALVVLAWSSSA